VFHKIGFFLIAVELLASQEGLSSTELFSPAPKTILKRVSPYVSLVSAFTFGNLTLNSYTETSPVFILLVSEAWQNWSYASIICQLTYENESKSKGNF